jgi:ribosomal protein L7Ae-like RNA K-turn-binding protein
MMQIQSALQKTVTDARKQKKLKNGFKDVCQAIYQKKADLVLKSEDTEQVIQNIIQNLCSEYNVPLFTISDRNSLAIWAGQSELWGENAIFYGTSPKFKTRDEEINDQFKILQKRKIQEESIYGPSISKNNSNNNNTRPNRKKKLRKKLKSRKRLSSQTSSSKYSIISSSNDESETDQGIYLNPPNGLLNGTPPPNSSRCCCVAICGWDLKNQEANFVKNYFHERYPLEEQESDYESD